MAMVKQLDKRSGITYVYESVSYALWSPEKRRYRVKSSKSRNRFTGTWRLPRCWLQVRALMHSYVIREFGLSEKLTVHSLRHTAASLMIANGTDVTTVAGILGHAQHSTTLDIYSHSFDKNKRAASAALQKSLDI